jgi:hypothetical protein
LAPIISHIGPNIDARGIASDLQRNLAVSDNPYLNPAPFSFAAGASSGRFAVFAVTIAPSIAAGLYNLNDFTILGGLTNVDFNPVARPTSPWTFHRCPSREP